MRINAVALLVLSSLLAAACGPTLQRAPVSPPAGAPGEKPEPEYRIQIGDRLDVKLFYNPELNDQVVVRPDGRISLQLIPEILAAGQTPAGLSRELRERYAPEVKQPEVTVIIREFGSQRVFVDGEVGSPKMVPILGMMTVLQAIAEAGGMKETARATEVVVIRRGAANAPLAFRVDLKKARNGSDPRQDVALAPFDIIFVPRSRIANLNVWMDQYIRKNIPVPFGFYYGLYQ